jgi:hypothetical protein
MVLDKVGKAKFPIYKFVPLVYQIVSQLGQKDSRDEFQVSIWLARIFIDTLCP